MNLIKPLFFLLSSLAHSPILSHPEMTPPPPLLLKLLLQTMQIAFTKKELP